MAGERERVYWQGLPEATRRGARKLAGEGPVGIVKKGKKELAREVVEARIGKMNGNGDEREAGMEGQIEGRDEPDRKEETPRVKIEDETPTRRTKKPLKIKFT